MPDLDSHERPVSLPAHAFPARTPNALLALARAGLGEAAGHRGDGMRYAAAHLAALRAAAAVVAARPKPAPGRQGRLPSIWEVLPALAPELAEWSLFFAASTTKRAAAEAGIPQAVTSGEADDLLRTAGTFVSVVETALGGGAG